MTTNPYRGHLRETAKAAYGTHTKTRQLLIERMLMNVEHLKSEDVMDYHVQARVPEAWDTLEQDVDCVEKKVKLTIYIDASVAKFFQAMGRGYQARISRVLATFAQMRIVQVKRLNKMFEEELAKVAEYRSEI